MTPAILDGRWMVRISMGAIPTEREHIAGLWTLLRREAKAALDASGKTPQLSEKQH